MISDILDTHEFATEFAWNGSTYTGVIGAPGEQLAIAAGGFEAGADQQLVCASAQFVAGQPRSKQAVIIGERTYRIAGVVSAPDGSFLVLDLQDPNRGV